MPQQYPRRCLADLTHVSPDVHPAPMTHARLYLNERAPDEHKQMHNVAGETLQENRGYLNWPTRLFKLGWIDENTRDGEEINSVVGHAEGWDAAPRRRRRRHCSSIRIKKLTHVPTN